MAAATMCVAIGVGLANAVDVSVLAAAEREWIDAGAFVLIAEPAGDSGTLVDVGTCEHLASVEGIEGSFASSVTDYAGVPSGRPGSRATMARVSPGIYGFFGHTPNSQPTVLLGPEAAERAGLTTGDNVVMTVEDIDGEPVSTSPVASIIEINSPILNGEVGGTYLTADLMAGGANRCYVSTGPAYVESLKPYLMATLSSDEPVLVRPLLSANTYGADFTTDYHSRILRWAWAAGALVLIALWSTLRFSARAATAVYATFGVHRRARVVMHMSEWALITGLGAVWGWATASAFALALGADTTIALTQTTFQILATWCTAGIGTLLISLLPVGSLIDALKERT